MANKFFVKDGSNVRQASKIFVNDGGTIREATKIWANSSGTVRQIYAKGYLTTFNTSQSTSHTTNRITLPGGKGDNLYYLLGYIKNNLLRNTNENVRTRGANP